MFEVGVVGPLEYRNLISAADFRAVKQIRVLWIASPLSAKRIQNLNRTNQIVETEFEQNQSDCRNRACSYMCSQF